MNIYREQLRNVYWGILNNYSTFSENAEAHFTYDLQAPEFAKLRGLYALESIAKTGTSFEKAKRLLHYFASRLTHNSYYDNHVECNALQLLSYSLENSEHGINCLNKSKILSECCLAIGIYARRVFIHPFSPFDFDYHVVCEIFDEHMNKWIMLDPTTDGYFVDESGMPLSLLEIRNNFISSNFQTYISSTGRKKDLQKTRQRNEGENLYIMKNCFRLSYEQYNGFGKKKGLICLVPQNYSVCKNEKLNYRFRTENMPKEYRHLLEAQEKHLSEFGHLQEPEAYTVKSVYASPAVSSRPNEILH